MKEIKKIQFYCTGCGLCERESSNPKKYKNGFYYPDFNSINVNECKKMCLIFDDLKNTYGTGDIYGNYYKVWKGWANDEIIRYKASSGGVLTEISLFLLEKGIVDGIIHSVSDSKMPWRTITVCSQTRNEVLSRCGSRYAQSSPLRDIINLIENDKKYVFIGKPCDVYALNKFLEFNSSIKKNIVLTMSFFCAGQPSENANIKLVKKLIGENINECIRLDYRGNGWPGKARAISSNGYENCIDYEESWGKILGRDIRPICRYCMVGMGESADISCGDLWNLNKMNMPSFEEDSGRNIIFGRTKVGCSIIAMAANNGYLHTEELESLDNLRYIQPSQYDRKTTMQSKVIAMRIMRKPYPKYNKIILSSFSKKISKKRRWEVFKGTIGRIVRHRL